MVTPEQLWPPFALTVTAGPLTLRAVRDEDKPALLELVLAGVHNPAVMPFSTPWTDAAPADLLRQSVAYYWRIRADFSPSSWSLDLVVRVADEIVGGQGLFGENFTVTRVADTGSWLGRAHQGRGIGTLMRQAACALVLDHLDGEQLTSAAFEDNPASLAVSRKVGYVDNGVERRQRRDGELAVLRRLILTPDAFVRGRIPSVPSASRGFGARSASTGRTDGAPTAVDA